MDDADRAQSEIDLTVKIALANRPSKPLEIGVCRYCSEPIESGIYCDDYCGSIYEKNN